MPEAAAGAKDELEDSDFEVDVEDDDDVPLARKKLKSARWRLLGINCIINNAPHNGTNESSCFHSAVYCCPLHQLKFAIWLSASVLVHDRAANNLVFEVCLCSLPNISYFHC